MLANELVSLSTSDIKKLPCDDFLKDKIVLAASLKAGARKRQVKYITKHLRQEECEPLFTFMSRHKGSRLAETRTFHQLERFRDDLIDEALRLREEAWQVEEVAPEQWESATLDEIVRHFPRINTKALQGSAMAFARNHQKRHSREIFRILKASAEQQKMDKEQKQ